MREPRIFTHFHQRAQSLAETALLLPLLTVLLLGTVDFGRAFFTQVAITNAARVGAAYGMDARWTPNEVKAKVIAEAGSLVDLKGDEVTVSCARSSWDASKYDVTVTVVREFVPVAPFTATIFGGRIELRASATARQVNTCTY